MKVQELLSLTKVEQPVKFIGELEDGNTIEFMAIKNDFVYNLHDFYWLHQKEVLWIQSDPSENCGKPTPYLTIVVKLN